MYIDRDFEIEAEREEIEKLEKERRKKTEEEEEYGKPAKDWREIVAKIIKRET